MKADSRAGASMLVHATRFDPQAYPWLSWRWAVERFVDGEDLSQKHGSDASGRVYVYFDTIGMPWQKRNVDYVWSAVLPVGALVVSPFAHTSKMIVAESGRDHADQWRLEAHNLVEDYHRCFGPKTMPAVVAIGLMTDTDSAHGQGLAYFTDVRVSQQQPVEPNAPASP